MKELISAIKELEQHKIMNVKLIALVSASSSEVVFYCDYDGSRVQSNSLVEEYNIGVNIVDAFYDKITTIIRTSNQFAPEKMNIVKVEFDDIQWDYEEKVCRTYRIIKEWTQTTI